MDLTDFMELKGTNPDRYASMRQRAKAVNFGIPGGLGAASLVAHARATYGVELTVDEAQEFRRRLISQIYPELKKYLADGSDGDSLGSFFAWSYRRRPLHAFTIDGKRHHVTNLASYKRIASLFEKRSRA